ncbi:MAG: hypothetical protein ACOX6T_10725 [Myxococcales bacterium]|jgi:hypothetical protein
MTPAKLLAALAAIAAAASCSTAPPKPTGAGSTATLRLLRDWRGVWSGQVKDSPMGAMPYTLYVTETGSQVHASMAPQRDINLEGMQHEYDFINFTQGTPFIRYSLTQRNATQTGDLVYQESLSTDDTAVFCPPDRGCVKAQLTFVKLDDRSLLMRAMVHEDRHSEIELRFVTSQIPKAAAEIEPVAPVMKRSKAEPASKPAGGEPTDSDLYLEDHVDEDIREPSADY